MSDKNHEIPSESISETLDRIRTAGSITISPELFEQLYLAPKTRVTGKLRQTFGNPTPLGRSNSSFNTQPSVRCLLVWNC